MGAVAESGEDGRGLLESTRFSLGLENGRTDAARGGRTINTTLIRRSDHPLLV